MTQVQEGVGYQVSEVTGEKEMCPICQQTAERVCSGCHSIFYCSAKHQKEHWKCHKEQCRPYIVKRNEEFGRYLVAARDLPQGSIVMTEGPLVIGPKRSTYPICLGCHKKVDGTYRCSKCTFPLCDENCENSPMHSENECPVFQNGYPIGSRITNFESLQPAYEAVTPLRCLLVRDRDPAAWTRMNTMEHHNEMRKAMTVLWNRNQNNTVKLLRDWYKLKDDFDEDEINSVMGFIDVNCFEIKTKFIEICGLYQEASLMSHDCVPNTHHAITTDSGYRIIIRTSVPVKKGEMITTCYANHLHGTLERRNFLKETKYFDCMCERCKDPTEFKTYMSGVKCPQCPEGYLLPQQPTTYDETLWICIGGGGSESKECTKTLTSEKMQTILAKLKKEIESVETSTSGSKISRLERLLRKFSGKSLHPNHFLLLDIIRKLTKLYLESTKENSEARCAIEKEVFLRKRELCQHYLCVLDMIDPGLSRYRGVTLYHLYTAEFPLYRREYKDKDLSTSAYFEKLNGILAYLETARETLELDRLVIDKPVLALQVDHAIQNICSEIASLN